MLPKEPGLYCFLLRCKKPKTEPFMERVVETILPREVRKLASAIEETDNQIQTHQREILRLNEETDDLIKNRLAGVMIQMLFTDGTYSRLK